MYVCMYVCIIGKFYKELEFLEVECLYQYIAFLLNLKVTKSNKKHKSHCKK